MGKSMLDREEYVVGGISKAIMPALKRVYKIFKPNEEQKAIRAKIDKVHSEVAAALPTMKKQAALKEVAAKNDLTPGQVGDIEKLVAFERGGGAGKGVFGELRQMVRASTTEPTYGQKQIEDTGDLTRAANIKAAETGKQGLAAGVVGTSLLAGGASMLMDNDDDDDAVVKKEEKVSYSLADLPEEGAATYETEDKTIYTNSAFKKAAQKAKGKTFKYEGTTYNTEAALDALERLKKAEGGEISDEDSFRMMYNSYKQEMEAAESSEEQQRIQQNFQQQTQNVDQEVKMNVFKEKERSTKAEGGSLLVPPEMGMEEEMPVDTFTPEEQAMAGESQVPDNQMEDDYMGFVLDESLDETEQQYLMGALESDSRLSEIFDKVIMTASEFSGAGEVEGPGDGVSDSIPARLSDGEFVVTEEATSEIGADNLQTMMDDAERKAEGGKVGYAEGGLLSNPYGSLMKKDDDEDLIEQSMLGSNQMPSLMGGRR